MRNVLEYKTPSVSPENENNVLTITGAVPLTTACFEFQDEGDVNVFTACFPQSREYSAGRREAGREAGGRQEGGREAGRRTPGPVAPHQLTSEFMSWSFYQIHWTSQNPL